MANLALSLYILLTSAGLIVLKLGTQAESTLGSIGGRFSQGVNALTIVGIFIYGLSFLLYIYLISKFELGFIIPLTAAFVYAIVFLASFVIFKESFTTLKILGIVSILLGLFLLNQGR